METPISCHVVAIPYPGRGHLNPVMNFCKLIARKRADILISFVVTEEWLGFISSETKTANIHFRSIPNVIPSERVRASDLIGFIEAILTKLEAPVEEILERLETPASVLIFDSLLPWVVRLGSRRNIPVASFWTQSASVFSTFHHYDLLVQNGHFPANLAEQGEELVDYIPGMPPTRIADLPTPFYGIGREVLHTVVEAILLVSKSQYLLLSSINELEAQVIEDLKSEFQIPVYSIGPAIPYFNIGDNTSSTTDSEPDYLKWLDNQLKGSVLYISQGSFLSVSNAQLDEVVAGIRNSGVTYLWIARGEGSRFGGNNGKGLVLPWCDQLKVLCHPSIGGFWSHCGWNSTKESVFAGVPMLTFPLLWDQVHNSKMIVEDWRIGWKVKRVDEVNLVTREEIEGLVRRFMDLESEEGKEMRRRAEEIKEICRQATGKGGSAEIDIDAFIRDISQSQSH